MSRLFQELESNIINLKMEVSGGDKLCRNVH